MKPEDRLAFTITDAVQFVRDLRSDLERDVLRRQYVFNREEVEMLLAVIDYVSEGL